MKRLISVLNLLLLASSIMWAQTGAPAQSAPSAQPGQAQQKQDQSECMKWAKQQVGLDQSSSSQQPSSSANANEPGAVPDKNTKQTADNNSQSNATSGAADAVSGMAGSLGGAANSKTTQLLKQAYSHCMEKKGYKIK